ncbi:unnamed protein product [Bursaphelenchus okinawaensis]|uniref:L-Fucosyltransferase n=1 Tax=Bursaphelenchus okinawaensis TaxID=465554 RepID=A0A811L738_9BILA|nr:unnamed protein product [Bursaphelenchus okinawaensis]CAG9118112.1 unnamed protein product [Bursaphelenchus okinawaensis]
MLMCRRRFTLPTSFLLLTSLLLVTAIVILTRESYSAVDQDFFILDSNSSVQTIIRDSKTENDSNSSDSMWKNFTREVTVDSDACGGLANMIFRIASLYGISRKLERTPFLWNECALEYQLELNAYFPNTAGLEFRTSLTNFTPVSFGNQDWTKDNYRNLQNVSSEPSIQISGMYLQSFKYFDQYKDEIRKIFDGSEDMKNFLKSYLEKVFPNITSHKLCVHARRGFDGHYMISTEPHFTLQATKKISEYLLESLKLTQIDAIIFSDDRDFATLASDIIMNRTRIEKVHASVLLNRAEEMIMAHNFCDSFILTSTGSTFGWWMAYLMREKAQKRVFYNGLIFKPAARHYMEQNFVEQDYVPPHWTRIQEFNHEVYFYDRRLPSILF